MRGLHAREAFSRVMALLSAKPRHQNMYASAVAGARPRPASAPAPSCHPSPSHSRVRSLRLVRGQRCMLGDMSELGDRKRKPCTPAVQWM